MTSLQPVDFRELARRLVEAAGAEPVRTFEEPGASTPALETSPNPIRRLEDMPREVGVLLASVGVLGFVLPGIAGAPALVAGGLVLWPKTFGKVEGWLSNRFPKTHHASMRQVGRFLDDLDRRFPRPELPQA